MVPESEEEAGPVPEGLPDPQASELFPLFGLLGPGGGLTLPTAALCPVTSSSQGHCQADPRRWDPGVPWLSLSLPCP